ncbi:hypothetical protein Aspvir_004896 [Aspergillus viridinutans]|uniref:Glutathione S-transferase n=1 Tax=Aspergillus viridinutans TaxID=75553 RepID=A0A9P3F0R7_ASPVI|nr:uncharacterized protein Aspvir_004896 [Aspergillus viridinutans]GIK00867.1 hypothetical protein Aspvir_004896 [Aspergillus viridinutans]
MAKYRVYNRRQQGLAETTRLILEISGAEYENLFPEARTLSMAHHNHYLTRHRRTGKKKKVQPRLDNCPFSMSKGIQANGYMALLKIESIAESHSMERFLAANLGLLGSTPVEAAVLDMYHAAWSDMIAMFMWKVWRESDQDAKKRGAAEFWLLFPKFLETHEKILASRGPFYGGDQPSLPDIYAFTWLNRFITEWIPSPPGSITEDKYPRMWELWRGIRENIRIKDYFESGRWQLKE